MAGAAQTVNYIIDILFFLDIFIIFNSATYNDDFEVISDRGTIVTMYLQSWFALDVIAIFPFEFFLTGGNAANLVRFIRIGRITKMLKLMKLARLMKLSKGSSKSGMNWITEFISFRREFKWFLTFFFQFAMATHVIACFWIIAANLDQNTVDSWINNYS